MAIITYTYIMSYTSKGLKSNKITNFNITTYYNMAT